MDDASPQQADPSRQDVFLARLAGGLAHEIKNPLSTMAINLALLEEEWERAGQLRNPDAPEPTARERRSLKRIKTLQREVQRLEHILDEFLSFARRAAVNRKPEDLSRIVRELLEFVEPEDERAHIRHHVDLPVGLPLVLVDEVQIKQAFLNLLVNARQAMSDGGELVVQARRMGTKVEVTLTDTGAGMSDEKLARCFDEYWSDKKGGTGLGLSTAKRIIEEHGGTIMVISEVGRGTSFSVLLPLAVEITAPSRPAGAEGTGAAAAEPGRGAA
jgi:two-component system, NtrC family, sensor histidine kinase HydH